MGNRYRHADTASVFIAIIMWNMLFSTSTLAEVSGPGWINGMAPLVSLEEAEAFYSTQNSIASPLSLTSSSVANLGATINTQQAVIMSFEPEIIELARGLQNDPKLIYDYVHNHITYVPYLGLLKGASLTSLSRSGNDLDQANLMVELLRASGYTAQYVRGLMTIPNTATDNYDLTNWLGVDSNNITYLLRLGGIPHTPGTQSTVIQRYWVKVMINGVAYYFDPAFKKYKYIPTIDLATVTGYNPSTLMAAAGGEQGSNYVRSVDESAVRALISSYSSSLISYIRSTQPNAEAEDIIGGRKIVTEILSNLPASMPFSPEILEVWDAVPGQYYHLMTLTFGSINKTLRIADISGKKLAITFDASGATTPNAGIPDTSCPKLVGGGEIQPGNIWDFGSLYPSEWSEECLSIYVNNTPHNVYFTSNPDGAFSIVEGGGTSTGNINIKIRFNGLGAPGNKTAKFRVANAIVIRNYTLTGTLSAANITGTLWLDDVAIAQSSSIGWDATFRAPLTISIDHSYAGNNGTYADQTANYSLRAGGTYVVAAAFGGNSSGKLLAIHQDQLDKYKANGLSNDSSEVLTESLYVVGQSWMNQTDLSGRLVEQITNITSIYHHRVGIVGYEQGYYLDIKQEIVPTWQRSGSYDETNPIIDESKFAVRTLLGSAAEHGVLEQLQLGNKPAVSTIKLLQVANEQGKKIFGIDSTSIASVIPQLVNYTTSELQSFQSSVNAGELVILPDDGKIDVGGWQGAGYISVGPELGGYRMKMAIERPNGLLFGGIGIGNFNVDWLTWEYSPELDWFIEDFTWFSVDPVDMTTGAYYYNHTDLSVGLEGIRQLEFSRTYNSDEAYNDEGMGYGWTHNFDVKIDVHSSVDASIGMRTPVDAAALTVASYVMRDVLKAAGYEIRNGVVISSQPSIKEWVVSALIAKWAMDQLLNNAASVKLNDKVLTYISLPDGTYNPPSGITTNLTKTNGLFKLKERFGTIIDFNVDNQISKITDVDGNSSVFTYIGGKLNKVKSSFGPVLTFSYNISGQLERVDDGSGRFIRFEYIGHDLSAYLDPDGKSWRYKYNDHHMIALTDPLLVDIATNTYDTQGRVATQTVPRQGGAATTFNFYFTDYRNIEENQTGNQTIYSIDNKGRTVAIQDALGNVWATEFDGQNHVVSQSGPRGNTSQYIYDGNQNLRTTINALGQRTENNYDSLYRLITITDPLSNVKTLEYDSENHLALTRNAAGDEQTSTYYPNGLALTSTDSRNTVTTLTYDGFGNPNTSRVAAHPLIDYSFDTMGRLTSLTDQENAITTFLYNNRGLVTEITDPLLKKTRFTYDDAGRLSTRTDRNLSIVNFGYTPSGKVETITYPDTTAVNYTYTTVNDNVLTMTDSLGVSNYSYDVLNRLTGQTDPNGFTVGYAYDTTGNLNRITYPGNKTVTYTHDALNRIKTISIDWLNKTASYFYDAAGRQDYIVNFNGTVTDYTYDSAGRLTRLVHTTNSNQTIASYQFPILDGNGNRVQEIREEPQLPLNLTTETVNYTYNTQKNRLRSTTTDIFGHDNEGQTINKNGTTYRWDFEHRLTGMGTDQFFYDGAGNRLKATRSGVTTKYIYDRSGNLLAEANNAGTISRYYIHGLGLMAFVQNNKVYVYHHDAIGNTVSVTDQAGTVVSAYGYTPYGQLVDVQETIQQPFTYVGQFGVMSEPNGLYYMRARYYDPSIGRFISEDPAGLGAGVNLYAYVGGNPVSRNDPSGLHFGLSIIGTPVENSFPFNPNPALVGGVSNGVGGLLGGALLCGLPCAAGGAVAGAFSGTLLGGQEVAPAAAGFVPLLSQSAVSGAVPTSAVFGAGIEAGILAFGPDGNTTAKNIFASTVAGGVLGPLGAASGFVGSSTSSGLSIFLSRGSSAKP